MFKDPITPAEYRSVVRKLHSTYQALEGTLSTARGYAGEQIVRAMHALRDVPDLMRVQVCTDCTAGDYSCQHPKVPRYDVRTGKAVVETAS